MQDQAKILKDSSIVDLCRRHVGKAQRLLEAGLLKTAFWLVKVELNDFSCALQNLGRK